MNRPLLISDCDEVLLHMCAHFGEWLSEVHGIDFAPSEGHFADALTRRSDGSLVASEDVWPLLDSFFATEMHRQTLVPGAAEALGAIGERADIIILTNLMDHYHAPRVSQLDALGIRHRVVCNQGGKGGPVARLVGEMQASATVFVDDLAGHHTSVNRHAPDVWRLHMVGDPLVASLVTPAPDAHARIDIWADALPWICARLDG